MLAQRADPVVKRLDPATRAKLLSAFVALVILGLGLIVLTWLGARVTRRYMRGRDDDVPDRARPAPDDWARHPLPREQRDESNLE